LPSPALNYELRMNATEDLTPTQQRGVRKAARAGLYYVNDFDAGYTRRRCGKGFTFLGCNGKTLKSPRVRDRIQSLVIPPAWTDVWICRKSNGHIQARGNDEAERTQYLYHEKWQAISNATKYDRMQLFAEVLPRIRRRVRKDLTGKRLERDRVLAAVLRLLDKAQLRIGNERYVEERGTRGATTLTADHVEVDSFEITLDFPAKSGKRRTVNFRDKKASKVIQQCEELDGQYLFAYVDEDGAEQSVDSSSVNFYLKEIANEPITAKDFRTWWGSVTALDEIAEMPNDLSESARKKLIGQAISAASEVLGNTKAICRSSYIHPAIIAAAESNELPDLIGKCQSGKSMAELTNAEMLFANLLPKLDA